jgi:hypothetical protein
MCSTKLTGQGSHSSGAVLENSLDHVPCGHCSQATLSFACLYRPGLQNTGVLVASVLHSYPPGQSLHFALGKQKSVRKLNQQTLGKYSITFQKRTHTSQVNKEFASPSLFVLHKICEFQIQSESHLHQNFKWGGRGEGDYNNFFFFFFTRARLASAMNYSQGKNAPLGMGRFLFGCLLLPNSRSLPHKAGE